MITEMISPVGRYRPLATGDPIVGWECPGCGQPLKVGEVPALVNGTISSVEEALKAFQGLAHTVEAAPAHEDCAVAATT